MKILRLFSRITFLYNLCMLAAFGMKYYTFLPPGSVQSTVIVSGLVLAVAGNSITLVLAGFLLLAKTPVKLFHPRWLFITNLLFFIIQIYLVLK